MTEVLEVDEHLAMVTSATEAIEGLLHADTYADDVLLESFNELEKTVFAATKGEAISLVDGLLKLSMYCGMSRQCAIENSAEPESELFYAAKADTYRQLLESMQDKTAASPAPTDTGQKEMSGAKRPKI